MSIQSFLQKARERGQKLRQMQEDARLEKMVEQRMKSPQERELEDFLERERQEEIKQHLQFFRDREKSKILNGSFGDTTNIFKGHKNILAAPNMFKMKNTMNGGNMFFK